jgi:hypothetical protein
LVEDGRVWLDDEALAVPVTLLPAELTNVIASGVNDCRNQIVLNRDSFQEAVWNKLYLGTINACVFGNAAWVALKGQPLDAVIGSIQDVQDALGQCSLMPPATRQGWYILLHDRLGDISDTHASAHLYIVRLLERAVDSDLLNQVCEQWLRRLRHGSILTRGVLSLDCLRVATLRIKQ